MMENTNRSEILKLLESEEANLRKLQQQLNEYDPFWSWKPNNGEITSEGLEVLKRYLKPADIPDRVNGQLDRLLSKADVNGTSGGSRAGKSDCETIDGIIKSTGELPDSLEPYRKNFTDIINRARRKIVIGRVTGVDNKQLHRVVIPFWQRYVPRAYLKCGDWEKSYSKEFDILTLYRDNKPCAKIEFLTNEQSVKSAQGNTLDWAKFDEEPDREKWKETLTRFGTADRLDISVAFTPTEGLTWATELFHEGKFEGEELKSSTALFKLTPVSNPFVNKDTLIKIMDEFQKVSSYDEMRMRLLGDAISLSGLIYGDLFNNTHIIEPFPTHCNCNEFRPEEGHNTNCPVNKYFVRVGVDPHLVTPSAAVFVGVDRMGNKYVFNSYMPKDAVDTDGVKADIHRIAKDNHYRWGQTIIDKSANSDIEVLGGLNVFRELTTGKNALRGALTSEKHEGSIKAGVDEIKKHLKENPVTRRPSLFIFDVPENKQLIKSFRTLERDSYQNEDKKGMKDRIQEGKHHLHAALRYCFQYRFNWCPELTKIPEVLEERFI